MTRWLFVLAVLASSAVFAAPPPGHPSPAQARELLMPDRPPLPSELPNAGTVLATMDANEFTYIEVARDSTREWIAAPKAAFRVGARIRYEEGAVMTNFYSKLLKRTFPRLMFVGQVIVEQD